MPDSNSMGHRPSIHISRANRDRVCVAGMSFIEKWLPFLNTYRTMCVSPEPEFRQVLEEIRWLDLVA